MKELNTMMFQALLLIRFMAIKASSLKITWLQERVQFWIT